MALAIGAPAPAVGGPTRHDTELNISSLRGKWVVLYFYPRDNTPGRSSPTGKSRSPEGQVEQVLAKLKELQAQRVTHHLRSTSARSQEPPGA